MKIVVLFLLGALNAYSLTKEEIQKIVKMPHDRSNLVEGLKIFPEAREYRVGVTVTETGKAGAKAPELEVLEKTVKGKYIVTQFQAGDVGEMIMVVEFDPKTKAYHKWVLAPQEGEVGQMVGTGDFAARSIAWATVGMPGEFLVVSHEKYGAKEVTWSEIHFENSKVVRRIEGKAIQVK